MNVTTALILAGAVLGIAYATVLDRETVAESESLSGTRSTAPQPKTTAPALLLSVEERRRLEREIGLTAETLDAVMPHVISDDVTATAVRARGTDLEIDYTLTSWTSTGLHRISGGALMGKIVTLGVRRMICQDQRDRALLDRGAGIRARYFGRDGDLLTRIRFDRRDCESDD